MENVIEVTPFVQLLLKKVGETLKRGTHIWQPSVELSFVINLSLRGETETSFDILTIWGFKMVAPKYKCYFPFSWHSNITKMMAWTKGLLYDGLSPLLAWGMGWWDFLEGWDENDFGAGLLLVFLFLLLFSSLFISCSARSFFSKYRECQEDYHDGDIIRLSAITRREHMQSNELMTTLRWGFFLCSLPSLHWSVLELTAICLRLSLWTTSFLRFWAVQGFLFLSHFVFSAGAWWSATDKNIFSRVPTYG